MFQASDEVRGARFFCFFVFCCSQQVTFVLCVLLNGRRCLRYDNKVLTAQRATIADVHVTRDGDAESLIKVCEWFCVHVMCMLCAVAPCAARVSYVKVVVVAGSAFTHLHAHTFLALPCSCSCSFFVLFLFFVFYSSFSFVLRSSRARWRSGCGNQKSRNSRCWTPTSPRTSSHHARSPNACRRPLSSHRRLAVCLSPSALPERRCIPPMGRHPKVVVMAMAMVMVMVMVMVVVAVVSLQMLGRMVRVTERTQMAVLLTMPCPARTVLTAKARAKRWKAMRRMPRALWLKTGTQAMVVVKMVVMMMVVVMMVVMMMRTALVKLSRVTTTMMVAVSMTKMMTLQLMMMRKEVLGLMKTRKLSRSLVVVFLLV